MGVFNADGSINQTTTSKSGGGSKINWESLANQHADTYDKYLQQQNQQRAQQKQSQPQSNFFTDALGTIANVAKPVSQGGFNPLADFAQGLEGGAHQLVQGGAEVLHTLDGGAARDQQVQDQGNQQTIGLIKDLGNKIRTTTDPTAKARYQATLGKIMDISNQQDQANQQRQQQVISRTDLTNNAFLGGPATLYQQQLANNSLNSQLANQPAVGASWLKSQNNAIDAALKSGSITQQHASQLKQSAAQRVAQSTAAVQANPNAPVTDAQQARGVGALAQTAGSLYGSSLIRSAVGGITKEGIAGVLNTAKPVTGIPSIDEAINKTTADLSGNEIIAKHLADSAAANKNPYTKPQQISDTVRRAIAGSDNRFVREDNYYMKQTGQTEEQLIAKGQSLTKKIGDAVSHGLVTDQMLHTKYDGVSPIDIYKKYGEGTKAGQEFIDYTHNLRALDELNVRSPNAAGDAKSRIRSSDTKNDLNKAIAAYQARNPKATTDAASLKKSADDFIDYGVKHEALNKDVAEATKALYKHYVPLERAFDPNLVSPTITGGLKNVSQQHIIQEMVGSEKAPKLSFGASIDYADRAVGQSLQNDVRLEILRRQREGNFNGELVVDPELSRQGRDLRDLQSSLVETRKGLIQERKGVQTDKQIMGAQYKQRVAENKALEQKAIGQTKDLLNSIATKTERSPTNLQQGSSQAFGDVAKSVSSLSDKRTLEIFNAMSNYSPKKLSSVLDQLEKKDAQIGKIREGIEQFAARNQDLLQQTKDVKSEGQSVFQQLSEIRQDPVTHENVWTGLENGEKFSITMDPSWAGAIKAMNTIQQRNLVESGLRMTANAQKAFFTGPLAPIFSVVNAGTKNPWMIYFNGRRLSPFGARALASFFVPDKLSSKFAGFEVGELHARGANPENFTQTYNDTAVSALKYAAEGKNLTGKLNYIKGDPSGATKDFFHKLSTIGAVLGNQQRKQIATGAFINATKRGYDREGALQIAAHAYNEVLGNFNRTSRFMKDMEPLFLYSGATQAGIRSTLHAAKTRPAEFATKATVAATGIAGLSYLSLSTPAGQEYYRDMKDNGQMYNIENNLTYVAPWASKDPKTNKWSGVFKIPIVPDFRPFNKAINEQTYNFTQGKGVDPSKAAIAGFNYITGNFFTNSNNESNIDPGAALRQNTFVNLAGIGFGQNVGGGTNNGPLESSDIPAGKQGDALLKQLGFAGQVVSGKKGTPVDTTVGGFANQFYGSQGTQKGVGDRVTEVVNSRQAISTQITDALKANDFGKADKLANDFNSQVDAIKSYVSQSSTRKLTDKQVKLLNGLKVPTVAGSISPSSVQSRLKASTNP